jgi:hypothetical protein
MVCVVKYVVLLNVAKIKIIEKQYVRTTAKVKLMPQNISCQCKAISTADALK